MKKCLFMFAAFIAVLLTSVALTSCGGNNDVGGGDDDKDDKDNYTISLEVVKGSLADGEADMYQQLIVARNPATSATMLCTEAEAVAAFDSAVSAADDFIKQHVEVMKTNNHAVGASVVLKLVSSHGKVIKIHTWN